MAKEKNYVQRPIIPNTPMSVLTQPDIEMLFVCEKRVPAIEENQIDVWHEFRRSIMGGLAQANCQPLWYGNWDEKANAAAAMPFLKNCLLEPVSKKMQEAIKGAAGGEEIRKALVELGTVWGDEAPKFAFIEPSLIFHVLLERVFIAWNVIKNGGHIFFLLCDCSGESVPFFRWLGKLGLTDEEWGRVWGMAHHPYKRYDNSLYMLWPYAPYLELELTEEMMSDRPYEIGYVGYVHRRGKKFKTMLGSDGTYISAVWGKMKDDEAEKIKDSGADFKGPIGTLSVVEKAYRQCICTPVILPDEYDYLGLLTARLFESLYAGCLPFVTKELSEKFDNLFVDELIGLDSAEDCVKRAKSWSIGRRLEIASEQRKRLKETWDYNMYGAALTHCCIGMSKGETPYLSQDDTFPRSKVFISRNTEWKLERFKPEKGKLK